MKKLVVILSVLCFASFVTIFKLESIFASDDKKSTSSSNIEHVYNETQDYSSLENEKTESINEESSIDKLDNNSNITETNSSDSLEKDTTPSNKSTNVNKDINNVVTENNKEIQEPASSESNPDNESVKDEQVSQNEEITSSALTKDDALNLLKGMNPDLTYDYQGDENNFPTLKDKGLSGYVFLPNVDTDLGYFVDKNTSHIYYFHPSGYLELIK